MAAQWEYKVLTHKLRMKGFDYARIEQDLNELGGEGWEAFSTLTPSFDSGQAIEISVMLERLGA
ncbi:DUF4177 domain-containing protein [Nocardia grenadensis]|uniref:DUF4177 domain-containing protein n=1 Tax=Nocardia grenadensis TaxID=931537 RepID=UPI0007A3936C|nr:DUF4177 domain-containing protein [Nocardia grenadensis]